jgi:exopolysaccharide/PEP-CTERM locus tyrosine autokinase
MSTLIELAAQRLEKLRQAGVVLEPELEVAHHVNQPYEVPSGNTDSSNLSRCVEIDFEALKKSGIVSPHAARSNIADQYRVIKRPLISNATGKGAAKIENGNLIMITSALPGEGKSFTALNLAMSMATELDYTVMLVDADVGRPSIMNMLGLPASAGLLDLIADETQDVSSVLLRTNIDKLTILPSGTAHPRATELLASDAMVRLLNGMAKRYADRIIIFDSPPLLAATESRVLASAVGQVVMVVCAQRTLQADVRQALDMIALCPVKLMLLNQVRTSAKASYGYGYGYGYDYEKLKA